MEFHICQRCGHLALNTAPEKCPVCGSSEFVRNNTIFKKSAEKYRNAATEHVPAITITHKCGLVPETSCHDALVRIGQDLHPMEEKHYVRFVDCYVDDLFAARTLLTPRMNPAASFHLKNSWSTLTIIAQCTLHGYWMMKTALA